MGNFSTDEISGYVRSLREIGVVPSVVHPLLGPGLDDIATTKALGQKNPHTLAVWRCNHRHPELKFFNVGRRVFCSVESIMVFLAQRRK